MKKKILWFGLVVLFGFLALQVYTYYFWPFWKKVPAPIINNPIPVTSVPPEILEQNPNLPPTTPSDLTEIIKSNPEIFEYLTRLERKKRLAQLFVRKDTTKTDTVAPAPPVSSTKKNGQKIVL